MGNDLIAGVADKFLWLRSDGAYARLTDGLSSRLRPGRADSEPNSVRDGFVTFE